MMLATSCKKKIAHKGFTLRGAISNIADSSVVVLRVGDEIIDSSYVKNGNFKLVGEISKPSSAIICVKNTNDYRSFRLENCEVYFTAEKGFFENGKFTRLKLEGENDKLISRLK